MRMPSLFISHGSPETVIRETAATSFLRQLAGELPRPKAILVASAHWETPAPAVATGDRPATVYDFRGFDPRLRQIKYAAPGAPAVARQAATLLRDAGFAVGENPAHGWDHGVWVPLQLVYPAQDIPVAQVSIQPHEDPAYHAKIGAALRPLRDDGVMLVTSGAMTHNLRAFRGQPVDAPPPRWVSEFNDWMATTLSGPRRAEVLRYRELAPFAVDNHPEDEHLLPLFVAVGATGGEETIKRLHASYEHAVLAMDVYKFG